MLVAVRPLSSRREGKQWPCGEAAADQLSKLITGKQVRCVAVDTDSHGRTVSRCTVGTTDANRMMVATGYAVAYRRYSNDYVSAEQSAKASKRGIWSGTFDMPSDVRRAFEEPQPAPRPSSAAPARAVSSSSGACNIKGNRGSNGWIYHVPGMPYYDRTRAEEMFCSEREAQAAGYRRARAR